MSLVIDDGRSPLTAAVAPMSATSPRVAWMTTAGLLSLGAGAIHAAAIGVHAEHRPAALAFTAVARGPVGVCGGNSRDRCRTARRCPTRAGFFGGGATKRGNSGAHFVGAPFFERNPKGNAGRLIPPL